MLFLNKSSFALADYTTILKLLPPASSQIKEIESCLRRLKPRIEAAQKHETAEMLDKLKGLGNSILGKLFLLRAWFRS
jgi:hypothetical protein